MGLRAEWERFYDVAGGDVDLIPELQPGISKEGITAFEKLSQQWLSAEEQPQTIHE